MPHRFIIAIGTNYNHEKNVAYAKKLLSETFSDIQFSRQMLTKPVGEESASKEMFLNLLAFGETDESCDMTIENLKRIETQCGNSKSLRIQGKIAIDIDLLLYDDNHHHKSDWQRGYIKELLCDINFNQ